MMGFVELNKGCEVGVPCFGPRGYFITLFGTELRLLVPHLIIAFLIGLALFGMLFYLKRSKRINLDSYKIIIISAIIALLNFILFAFLYPRNVVY